MTLSLAGERSRPLASSANPFVAFARWVAQAQATRSRRVALSALLEFDRARLSDLGISRDDVAAAMAVPVQAGRLLSEARARSARA